MPILPALSALTLFAVLSAPPRLAIEPPGLVDLGSAGPLEAVRGYGYRYRTGRA